VREGVDLLHTGTVRSVDTAAIRHRLDDGQIVLVPPLGFSPSGEVFNLEALELAANLAIELHAAKLVLVEDGFRLAGPAGEPIRQLSVRAARDELNRRRAEGAMTGTAEAGLEHLTTACRHTVRRGHLLDARVDGALVLELFTRDGVGTMVASDAYDETRPATRDDVAGIAELIAPFEAEGLLLARSRESLERDVDRFLIMERDGSVIGCAALYPFGGGSHVELACFAVHPRYRKGERGEALLARAEAEARTLGGRALFVLTTQTAHWFREHGFEPASPADLPPDRAYDRARNAKVLLKRLG
jgi:amino-acid N-acetyltransferase